jgi:hypothetical protein
MGKRVSKRLRQRQGLAHWSAHHDAVPSRWLSGLVLANLIELKVRAFARGIHSKVEADFPFEQADFVLCAKPWLFQEGGEED